MRTGVARAQKFLLRIVHELQHAQPAPLNGEAPRELEPLRRLWYEQDLESLAREGLSARYDPISPEAEERLVTELKLIDEMGFSGYFLIVHDFINEAGREGAYAYVCTRPVPELKEK